MLSVQLLESNKQIEDKILREYAKELNKKIVSVKDNILTKIRIEAQTTLLNSDIHNELKRGGILAKIFGFRGNDGEIAGEFIIEQFIQCLTIDFSPFKVLGHAFGGKFEIGLVPFGLPAKTWNGYEFNPVNGDDYFFDIPWLKTILFDGDMVTFAIGYKVLFKPGEGRSGGAIMVESDTQQWKVPSGIRGTEQNNWFTRELSAPRFISLLEKVMTQSLA